MRSSTANDGRRRRDSGAESEVRLAESRYRIRNSRRSSLGSKTFTIGGGKTATVTLKLSAANRRLLKRSHALRVTVTLTGRDSDRVGFPTAKRTIRLIWRG